MTDTERGKEVGDRYKVLISDLLPPIYIYIYMIWSDKSVNLAYYWTCLTIRKRKGEKKRFAEEVVWKPQKSYLRSREYFLIQFRSSEVLGWLILYIHKEDYL